MEKQVHVSFYASLFRTECKVLTLEEIIILIRRRRWKNEILAYRTALAEGRAEEARKLKGGLPGFTPSGVFKGGHKASAIETYSQVVGLDFDHVKDLPALILTFRALSSTLAMFVSPGGEGLKVFVRVDCPAERHGEAYPLVAAFFEKAGGVASDAKCKDISRCCYVGDDGEAYYNPDAEVFHIPEKQSAEKGVDAFVARFLDRIPPLAGARNQTVYRLGCEANRRGFSYTETAACCTLRLQAADFTATEIEQALHSAYQGNINEHATYGGAKGQIDREISPTVFKTGHPLETEEIETSGEVLRERTPLIPDEVYGWLPDLFREAVAFYPQHRERDMALLGACTVASACLRQISPQTGVPPHFHRRGGSRGQRQGVHQRHAPSGRLVRRTDQDGNGTGRSRIYASPGRMGAEEGGGTPEAPLRRGKGCSETCRQGLPQHPDAGHQSQDACPPARQRQHRRADG